MFSCRFIPLNQTTRSAHKRQRSLGPFLGVLPKELPKSHPLMWPHDISVQQLLAGSVHGKAVAEDLLTEGGWRKMGRWRRWKGGYPPVIKHGNGRYTHYVVR